MRSLSLSSHDTFVYRVLVSLSRSRALPTTQLMETWALLRLLPLSRLLLLLLSHTHSLTAVAVTACAAQQRTLTNQYRTGFLQQRIENGVNETWARLKCECVSPEPKARHMKECISSSSSSGSLVLLLFCVCVCAWSILNLPKTKLIRICSR